MNENDVLRGGRRILSYLNTLMSEPITAGQLSRMIAAGNIRAGMMVGQLVATKTSIREDLARCVVSRQTAGRK